jgi:hypothetical protein
MAPKSTLNDIKRNTVDVIDLSMTFFNEGAMQAVSDAIKQNTSATQLIINNSEISDDEFAILVEGLLERKNNWFFVNVSGNDLSSKSAESLMKLIQSKKIQTINISCNPELESSTTVMRQLLTEAQQHQSVLVTNVVFQDLEPRAAAASTSSGFVATFKPFG